MIHFAKILFLSFTLFTSTKASDNFFNNFCDNNKFNLLNTQEIYTNNNVIEYNNLDDVNSYYQAFLPKNDIYMSNLSIKDNNNPQNINSRKRNNSMDKILENKERLIEPKIEKTKYEDLRSQYNFTRTENIMLKFNNNKLNLDNKMLIFNNNNLNKENNLLAYRLSKIRELVYCLNQQIILKEKINQIYLEADNLNHVLINTIYVIQNSPEISFVYNCLTKTREYIKILHERLELFIKKNNVIQSKIMADLTLLTKLNINT